VPGLDRREVQRIRSESRENRNRWAREWRGAAPSEANAAAVELLRAVAGDGAVRLVAVSASAPERGYVLRPDGIGGWVCGCAAFRQRLRCAHTEAAARLTAESEEARRA
jgi:hypothetical protein